MTHTIIFKTDYGHLMQVYVEEYNEITGVKTPADLSPYTSMTIIMKKPDYSIVNFVAVASGLSYVNSIIPSGTLSMNGHYICDLLLENDLQRFHSTEFGFDVTASIEQ